MHGPAIFIALFVWVALLALAAQRLRVPYPIAFVLGGLMTAFLPGLPEVRMSPEVIFLIFLPPLLTEAAYFTSLRDFRANLRPILLLAIGLVFITSMAIAYTFVWLFPAMALAVGFVLGGIVSPPDAVAASSIMRRLRVPRRIATILEGESLINDASGLVVFKFALAAVAAGTFSFTAAASQFCWMFISGIGIGLLLGTVFMRIFRYIREPSVEIASTFAIPYAAYLLAEYLNSSGILAVVAVGLVIGWKQPEVFSPSTRMRATAVWQMVNFILNGFAFVLIGLQFPSVLRGLSNYTVGELAHYALLFFGVAVAVRTAWVFFSTYGLRLLIPSLRRKEALPSWQNVLVIAWAGMRGVVSLAAALSLPYVLPSGEAFPARDLIIFLTYAVIFGTLVLQGLSLPWLIRALRLRFDFRDAEEEWRARYEATSQVLNYLKSVAKQEEIPESVLSRICSHYQDRLTTLGDGPSTPLSAQDDSLGQALVRAEKELWQQLIGIERRAIIALRKKRELGDEIFHQIQDELDLMYARFSR